MAKVMISLPDDLLVRLDREAKRRSTSRSGLLQEAARRELGEPDRSRMDEVVGNLRVTFSKLGNVDSEELVRQERDWLDLRDRARASGLQVAEPSDR